MTDELDKLRALADVDWARLDKLKIKIVKTWRKIEALEREQNNDCKLRWLKKDMDNDD